MPSLHDQAVNKNWLNRTYWDTYDNDSKLVVPKTITEEWLRRRGACHEGINEALQVFGKARVKATIENLVKLSKDSEGRYMLNWLITLFLTSVGVNELDCLVERQRRIVKLRDEMLKLPSFERAEFRRKLNQERLIARAKTFGRMLGLKQKDGIERLQKV